jgi:hypothetical protein
MRSSSEGSGVQSRTRLYEELSVARGRTILKRQLEARAKLWPDVTNHMLWDRTERDGFVAVPRLMPLMMSIMDDIAGKGFPVGQTYFEMWCRLFDELFLTLNRPEEMAFYAGFTGQRALRTWRDRVKRLAEMGFIDVKSGPLGDLSYAIFLNPYHVIKRAYLKNLVREEKYRALMIRANEVGAFDLDDVDDTGAIIPLSDDDDQPQKATPSKPRRLITRKAK